MEYSSYVSTVALKFILMQRYPLTYPIDSLEHCYDVCIVSLSYTDLLDCYYTLSAKSE